MLASQMPSEQRREEGICTFAKKVSIKISRKVRGRGCYQAMASSKVESEKKLIKGKEYRALNWEEKHSTPL